MHQKACEVVAPSCRSTASFSGQDRYRVCTHLPSFHAEQNGGNLVIQLIFGGRLALCRVVTSNFEHQDVEWFEVDNDFVWKTWFKAIMLGSRESATCDETSPYLL